MSGIIRPTTGALSQSTTPNGFSRPEGKALQRQQNAEVARGLVSGTRVQAAGFVAATGIQLIGMLSRETDFLSNGDPQAKARMDLVTDLFTEGVALETRRMLG